MAADTKTLLTTEVFDLIFAQLKAKIQAQATALSKLSVEGLAGSEITTEELNFLSGLTGSLKEQLDLLAPKANPAFTGVPTAPTAKAGTKTQQIATTEFVDTAIGVITEALKKLVDGGSWNPETKKIDFKHGDTVLFSVDGADFVKDGIVDNVLITEGTGDNVGKTVLKVIFNTDASKTPIEVTLDKVFNASNYYTSEQVDNLLKDYAKTSDVDEKLKEYVKTTDLKYPEDNYVDQLFAEW